MFWTSGDVCTGFQKLPYLCMKFFKLPVSDTPIDLLMVKQRWDSNPCTWSLTGLQTGTLAIGAVHMHYTDSFTVLFLHNPLLLLVTLLFCVEKFWRCDTRKVSFTETDNTQRVGDFFVLRQKMVCSERFT